MKEITLNQRNNSKSPIFICQHFIVEESSKYNIRDIKEIRKNIKRYSSVYQWMYTLYRNILDMDEILFNSNEVFKIFYQYLRHIKKCYLFTIKFIVDLIPT